jgi:uncharacterized protein (DUF1330 family)
MSEVKVYCIANVLIKDAETFRGYEKGFFGTIAEHNGQFLTMDDHPNHLEGTSPIKGRVIMWTFSNEEDLNNWYNSDNYQELSNKYRRPATELVNLTVVKGMPAR